MKVSMSNLYCMSIHCSLLDDHVFHPLVFYDGFPPSDLIINTVATNGCNLSSYKEESLCVQENVDNVICEINKKERAPQHDVLLNESFPNMEDTKTYDVLAEALSLPTDSDLLEILIIESSGQLDDVAQLNEELMKGKD